MNIKNYINYGMCIYENNISAKDDYKLGDVVINKENEIGVIIQMHSTGDFRTDMFGNASSSEVRLSTEDEIKLYRPKIWDEGTFNHNKVYSIQHNIGKAKYVVNYHDGVKTHKDGSPFFDIETFKSKVKMESFICKLGNMDYRKN